MNNISPRSRKDVAEKDIAETDDVSVTKLVAEKRAKQSSQCPVIMDRVGVTFSSDLDESSVVLNNVSLCLRSQELLVFIGHSGSGKTTALNVIAGLVTASTGRVTVLGGAPVIARSKMGYMFARDALIPWRTALSNVEFGLETRGVPRRDRKTIASQYLDLVHLGGFADRFPSQLSQGQRQRVALARTWAVCPDLLLMDEPFAALDAQNRSRLQREFLHLWEKQRTSAIFVTHDLQEAILIADRIVVFDRGRVQNDFVVEVPRPREFEDVSDHPDALSLYRELRTIMKHSQ